MCDETIGKGENAGREAPHPSIVAQRVACCLVHHAGVVG